MRRTHIAAQSAGMAACSATAFAQAGGLAVSPTRVDIPAERAAAVITLRNTGDAPMDLQIRVQAWVSANPDALRPTESVTASPPRATVAPGATQTVRFYRRNDAPAVEQPFRVLIDELPPPPSPVSPEAGFTLALPLRVVLPLFVRGTQPCTPALQAEAVRDDEPRLRLHNPSPCHARLTGWAVTGEGASEPPRPILAYVLGGTAWETPLPPSAAHRWTVAADTDGGPFRAEVAFGAAR